MRAFARSPLAEKMMLKPTLLFTAAAAALATATPAQADEVFGGILFHDVDTRITASGGVEDGVDFQLGYRSDRIVGSDNQWVPSFYAFVSANTAGHTNFAAAGFSWKFGDRIYIRPGVGLAIHDGPLSPEPGRSDLGSRILFEPELGVGVQVNDRLSVEAAWVHLSHATLFSGQNPGQDNIGVRLNYRF